MGARSNEQTRAPDLTLLKRIYRAMKWVGEDEAGAALAAIAERDKVAPEFVSNSIKGDVKGKSKTVFAFAT